MNYLERAMEQIHDGMLDDAMKTLSQVKDSADADLKALDEIRSALIWAHWNPDHYKPEIEAIDRIKARLAGQGTPPVFPNESREWTPDMSVKNPNAPKEGEGKRIHKCSICGKEGIWGDGWEWRYEIHRGNKRTGEPGWEDVIKTCSPECRKKDTKAKSKEEP